MLLVYDVGQKDSFEALDTWLAEMKQDLGPHGNMENVVFVVCANKVMLWNGTLSFLGLLWEECSSEFGGTKKERKIPFR